MIPTSRVTRRDVARRAGTSVAVVSYVVNDGPRPVAEATRERVLQAIAETGYRPDRVATALARGSTGTLGLLLPNIANPFLGELAHAIGSRAYARGSALFLADAADDREREAILADRLADQQVDGLIVYGVDRRSAVIDRLAERTPVVLIDEPAERPSIGAVGIDERSAAALATTHLISHGYASISAIIGPRDQHNSRERLAGWEDAFRLAENAASRATAIEAGYDRESGYAAAIALLSETDAPRAIFASNEQQALGVLAAAHELGIGVPDELALVTFNGTSLSGYAIPALTAVVQPLARLAADAVDMLIDRPFIPSAVVHEAELVLRRSCGCDPAIQGAVVR